MSRALSLAARCAGGGRPSPADMVLVRTWSPAERALLRAAMALDDSLQPASAAAHAALAATAAKLDAGGLWPCDAEVRLGFASARAAAAAAGGKMEEGEDAIAAGHLAPSSGTLQRMALSALPVGRVALGCEVVLTLCPLAPPPFVTQPGGVLHALVVDEEGVVAAIALHNWMPPSACAADEAASGVRQGDALLLREPYSVMAASGDVSLRVDNPCNVLVLPHAAAQDAGLTGDADALRARGNAKFLSGDYVAAEALFTEALACASGAARDTRCVLLSNRSAAWLARGAWDAALSDAQAASALDATQVKPVYRAARALCGLRRYAQAAALLEAMPPDPSGSRTAAAEAARLRSAALAAAAQAARGDYDLLTLPFYVPAQTLAGPGDAPPADAAAAWAQPSLCRVESFVGPLEVRHCAGAARGRGLFLTQAVPAGALLLAEMPLAAHVEEVDLARSAEEGRGEGDAAGGEGSTHAARQARQLVCALVCASQRTGTAASRQALSAALGALASDARAQPPTCLPDLLAHHSPLSAACTAASPLAAVSASHIAGAVAVNAWRLRPSRCEPGRAARVAAALAASNPLPPPPSSEPPPPLMAAPVNDVGRAALWKLHTGRSGTSAIAAALLNEASPAAAAVAVNTSDPSGLTPLALAAAGADAEGMAMLLRAGAAPDTPDAEGDTPLHTCAGHGWGGDAGRECLVVLLEGGASVDARNAAGLTPLHVAVACGVRDAAALLLAAGADPFAREGLGDTPWDLAHANAGEDMRTLFDEWRPVGAPGCMDGGLHSPVVDGCALWLAGGLMNHSRSPTARSSTAGALLMVRAARALREGEELTTSYSQDAEVLGRKWGIVEE